MIRRFGEQVRNDVRYTLRPGVYAILPRGGQVLLTYQAEPEPEFQLPGGGIDAGEQPVAALHREVYEETGWTISSPFKLGTYRRFCYMPDYDKWAEKVCHIYIARPIMRLGEPTETGHTAIWASWDDAFALIQNEGERSFMAQL